MATKKRTTSDLPDPNAGLPGWTPADQARAEAASAAGKRAEAQKKLAEEHQKAQTAAKEAQAYETATPEQRRMYDLKPPIPPPAHRAPTTPRPTGASVPASIVPPASPTGGPHPLAHVLRRETAVIPDDADHRNVDFRENVGWHAEQRKRRRQHDQHRHDDESVRPAQRQLNHGHGQFPHSNHE